MAKGMLLPLNVLALLLRLRDPSPPWRAFPCTNAHLASRVLTSGSRLVFVLLLVYLIPHLWWRWLPPRVFAGLPCWQVNDKLGNKQLG